MAASFPASLVVFRDGEVVDAVRPVEARTMLRVDSFWLIYGSMGMYDGC
jgi:hypothetical protein